MCRADAEVAIGMMDQLMRWDMDGALARGDALALTVKVFASTPLLSDIAVTRYGDRMDIAPVDLGGHFFLLQQPVKTAGLIRDSNRRLTANGVRINGWGDLLEPVDLAKPREEQCPQPRGGNGQRTAQHD